MAKETRSIDDAIDWAARVARHEQRPGDIWEVSPEDLALIVREYKRLALDHKMLRRAAAARVVVPEDAPLLTLLAALDPGPAKVES